MTDARASPRTRRRLLGTLGLAAAAIGLWIAGFFWFANIMPETVRDRDSTTDAIVVLTGGADRLQAGLDLLAAGKARKMLISGVYRGVDVAELLRISRGRPEDFDCCVALGYSADNTAGNAEETAFWMAEQNFASLRLVTASYHMPRSLLEFRRALPKANIVPHPVFPDHVKHDDWWQWPGTTMLYIVEYNKYLAALVRTVLAGLIGSEDAS